MLASTTTAQQLLMEMPDDCIFDPSDLVEIPEFPDFDDESYQSNFFDTLDSEVCQLCSCEPCHCVDNGGDN